MYDGLAISELTAFPLFPLGSGINSLERGGVAISGLKPLVWYLHVIS